MTYKLDEKQFWGNNLGYARPSVLAKSGARVTKTGYEAIKDLPNVIDHTVEEDEVFQDITNTAGAKIDKDVQQGLIKAVKFDEGKRDWSLLPYDSIEEIAKVLEFGKIKYAAWNWTEGGGFKYTRVFNASMRHLLAFMRGEDKDPDSGLSHIAHLGCNVLFLLHFILNKEKYNTCDDRRVP